VQSEKTCQLKPCWVRFQRNFQKSITWFKTNKTFLLSDQSKDISLAQLTQRYDHVIQNYQNSHSLYHFSPLLVQFVDRVNKLLLNSVSYNHNSYSHLHFLMSSGTSTESPDPSHLDWSQTESGICWDSWRLLEPASTHNLSILSYWQFQHTTWVYYHTDSFNTQLEYIIIQCVSRGRYNLLLLWKGIAFYQERNCFLPETAVCLMAEFLVTHSEDFEAEVLFDGFLRSSLW